jgi:hypothetical protein
MAEKDLINLKPKEELLFEENLNKFNQLKAAGKAPDLRLANLSGLDLRQAELKGLDLTGCYLRGTNLRGLDLTGCNLEGASLKSALVSGALFPNNVSAEELRLSLEHGTRIRIQRSELFQERTLALMAESVRLLRKMAGEQNQGK